MVSEIPGGHGACKRQGDLGLGGVLVGEIWVPGGISRVLRRRH